MALPPWIKVATTTSSANSLPMDTTANTANTTLMVGYDVVVWEVMPAVDEILDDMLAEKDEELPTNRRRSAPHESQEDHWPPAARHRHRELDLAYRVQSPRPPPACAQPAVPRPVDVCRAGFVSTKLQRIGALMTGMMNLPAIESQETKPRSVYVASSWRNPLQPALVYLLRTAGLTVYDFRNPGPGEHGFSWRSIDPLWETWSPKQWQEALRHPIAQAGYANDRRGMDEADCCVLLLPCGRSAHLEAGFMVGQKKRVFTLCINAVEPDLMNLLLGPPDHLCPTVRELFERMGILEDWQAIVTERFTDISDDEKQMLKELMRP